MTDYMARVAELLKNGETVIFYTVGSDTFLCVKECKARFGLLPTAICDRDPWKQGRAWRGLEGVPVLSPDEAIERFPEAYWLIPSRDYRFQIIGYLTQERNITPDHIINYVPVRKVRTCEHLQRQLVYDRTGELRFCWREPSPKVPASKEVNAAGWRTMRDRLLEQIEEDCVPAGSPCAGCLQIKEGYFPVQPRAWLVNYFCNSVCNYHCSYCTLRHATKVEDTAGRHTLRDVVEAARREDVLDDYHGIAFSTAGEPTLYPGRRDAYQAFDGAQFLINTNGFLYDPDLFELMSRKKVLLIDSIDAGTRETYRKIKGVDGFEKVRQNLRCYAQAPVGIVAAKYIFLPGVNDTEEEIDGFVDFCADVGATFVMIAVDYYSTEKITEHTRKMAQRMAEGLRNQKILCVPYMTNETEEYRKVESFLLGQNQ